MRRIGLLLPLVMAAAACANPAYPPSGTREATAPSIVPQQATPTPTTLLNKGAAPVPSSAIDRLTALSIELASEAGDSAPEAAWAVFTTRQEADLLASGAYVNSNQPVYLVRIQGQFALLDASRPAGQQAPTGRFLTYVVDAVTWRVLDSGVGDRTIDLSVLGPVTTLTLQAGYSTATPVSSAPPAFSRNEAAVI
jgi:hypothetical protein